MKKERFGALLESVQQVVEHKQGRRALHTHYGPVDESAHPKRRPTPEQKAEKAEG